MALWDRPDAARLFLHSVLGGHDGPSGFQLSLRMDGTGYAASLFRDFAAGFAEGVRDGRIRSVPWREVAVAMFSVIALRPATKDTFLVSQEPPERSEDEAREAWRCELAALARASLAPV